MRVFLFTLFLLTSLCNFAQSDSIVVPSFEIEGFVKDEFGNPITNSVVVNLDNYVGVFGDLQGKFKIDVHVNDKLSFRSIGKESLIVLITEELIEQEKIEFVLKDLNFNIDQVTIFAPRELNEIYEDIDALGFDKKDYMLSGLDAASSPITFLYQQFSKKEKEKRLAAELWNIDKKRELLKELFAKYAAYEIHDLKPNEFDAFIDFMNVSDSYMKSASQYEFVVFVKQRFHEYQSYRRNLKLNDEDYNYDQD